MRLCFSKDYNNSYLLSGIGCVKLGFEISMYYRISLYWLQNQVLLVYMPGCPAV